MNVSALKKCLEELKSDNCRKDYVIGILETLIEMDGGVNKNYIGSSYIGSVGVSKQEVNTDTLKNIIEPPELNEGQILEAKTQARIKEIKALSDKSTEMS